MNAYTDKLYFYNKYHLTNRGVMNILGRNTMNQALAMQNPPTKAMEGDTAIVRTAENAPIGQEAGDYVRRPPKCPQHYSQQKKSRQGKTDHTDRPQTTTDARQMREEKPNVGPPTATLQHPQQSTEPRAGSKALSEPAPLTLTQPAAILRKEQKQQNIAGTWETHAEAEGNERNTPSGPDRTNAKTTTTTVTTPPNDQRGAEMPTKTTQPRPERAQTPHETADPGPKRTPGTQPNAMSEKEPNTALSSDPPCPQLAGTMKILHNEPKSAARSPIIADATAQPSPGTGINETTKKGCAEKAEKTPTGELPKPQLDE